MATHRKISWLLSVLLLTVVVSSRAERSVQGRVSAQVVAPVSLNNAVFSGSRAVKIRDEMGTVSVRIITGSPVMEGDMSVQSAFSSSVSTAKDSGEKLSESLADLVNAGQAMDNNAVEELVNQLLDTQSNLSGETVSRVTVKASTMQPDPKIKELNITVSYE